ncbi:MAG: M1 family metallopeptidase [Saprospiraceae bacterium]|nr:M1 family metallopeptidase [Saprospiraceae bacterium]
MDKAIYIILLLFFPIYCFSQDCNFVQEHQANRFSTYTIHTDLNNESHEIRSLQEIVFKNHSDVPLDKILFYMYLNSFKHENSTFLKGVEDIFGQSFKDRKPEEWADIKIISLKLQYKGKQFDAISLCRYIAPDDGNTEDQSVMELKLPFLFQAGDTILMNLEWEARMPKVIARAGYSQDFYLFCHWFPQLGVLEKNKEGHWNWNCHQFFRNTEFYAEFSDYDVWIKCDKDFQVCASGEFVDEILVGNKKVKHYQAKRVIDFTWAINKLSYIKQWRWNNVDVRFMLPHDYSAQEKRFYNITNFSLEYMSDHVGYYPYSTLSIVCPPFHALRTGLMEYPTLITTGSLYGMPQFIRNAESLLIHEFVHQYFMAVLASNEKEEPWMDEGFATYYEDRVLDAAFGDKKSLFNVLGFQMDNKQLTRSEYLGMKDPSKGIIARPGWTFKDQDRKPLIYSKTATIFHSLERFIGTVKMDSMMRSYFKCFKFTHPRGSDFMQFLNNHLPDYVDSSLARSCYEFVRFGIFEEGVMDYSIDTVISERTNDNKNEYTINLLNAGSWTHPVEIKLEYESGKVEYKFWSGIGDKYELKVSSDLKLSRIHIDPEQKLLVDINLNDNSYSIKSLNDISSHYGSKIMFWWQNILHYLSLVV